MKAVRWHENLTNCLGNLMSIAWNAIAEFLLPLDHRWCWRVHEWFQWTMFLPPFGLLFALLFIWYSWCCDYWHEVRFGASLHVCWCLRSITSVLPTPELARTLTDLLRRQGEKVMALWARILLHRSDEFRFVSMSIFTCQFLSSVITIINRSISFKSSTQLMCSIGF